MAATGWRKGQINVLMSVRQTGKSTRRDIVSTPAIRILDQALVDGKIWYTAQCKPGPVSGWLQEQDSNLCYRHIGKTAYFDVYDIHEKLYTMLILKLQ